MKHQWNTGRQYDEHGQRIVAEVDRENHMDLPRIYFSDLSRHINGCIQLSSYAPNQLDTYAMKELVMCNYDYGNYGYSPTTLTWNEGEMK